MEEEDDKLFDLGTVDIFDYAPEGGAFVQRQAFERTQLIVHQLLGDHKLNDVLDLNWGASYNFVDNKVFPNNGFRLNTAYSYLNEINKNENVTEFDVQLATYIRIMNRPKLVFANSVGFKKVEGDLQFHQYADIGNTTSLRGYRNNRFRGESVFYHNMDLRLQVLVWELRFHHHWK